MRSKSNKNNKPIALGLLIFILISACDNSNLVEGQALDAGITRTGFIQEQALNEASGIQASGREENVYFLHNDDGKAEVFAINDKGENLGSFRIDDAENRDWEDIARVPSDHGPLLLLADIGDNFARQEYVVLNLVVEPEPGNDGRYSGNYPLQHSIKLTYPDGSRDSESIAYDPSSETIYLLSKRDKPSRLYSISVKDALEFKSSGLKFEGEIAQFRPPTAKDYAEYGKRQGQWVSQPTGLDFSPDGKQAVIITYRSIYLINRDDHEDWPAAFKRKPIEFLGPPSRQEEAVAYASNGKDILITSEGLPSPVYRFRLKTRD